RASRELRGDTAVGCRDRRVRRRSSAGHAGLRERGADAAARGADRDRQAPARARLRAGAARGGAQFCQHAGARRFSRAHGRAGVPRLLVIGGDRDAPAGSFHHAIEVIESGLPQSRGIREIGIAGYPEGHPRVAATEIDRLLAAKIEAAAATGLGVHIVTQFAFAPEPILAYVARLRERGIEQAVRIGIAGPASVATLVRFAAICGVATSARALARNAGLAKHLFGATAPDAILRALAGAQLGDVAPHFFTFGGLGASARWASAVAAGRFALDRTGGFRVEPP